MNRSRTNPITRNRAAALAVRAFIAAAAAVAVPTPPNTENEGRSVHSRK